MDTIERQCVIYKTPLQLPLSHQKPKHLMPFYIIQSDINMFTCIWLPDSQKCLLSKYIIIANRGSNRFTWSTVIFTVTGLNFFFSDKIYLRLWKFDSTATNEVF